MMSVHFRFSRQVLSLAMAAALLAACGTAPEQPARDASTVLAEAPLLRQDGFHGIYEVAVADEGRSVWVATIAGFEPQNGGVLQRLDARTLQALQNVYVPQRSFALGLNHGTGTLYVGNTLDGSLTVVDAKSGLVRGVIPLAVPTRDEKGEVSVAHTRKVIVDEAHNRIFVTSPGRPGQVWIVDGNTNALTHTITSDGIWTTGAAYDPGNNRLYVSQGGINEILAIDPDTGTIVGRFSTGDSTANTADGSKHFFINLAIDTAGQRLFSTDASTGQLYVFDIASGRQLAVVKVGGDGLLDVAFNPARNEIYTTHRGVSRSNPEGTGGVTFIDGSNYAIQRTLDLPVHPNSLALSPDGSSLYVTVKAPHGDKHPAWRKDIVDSVVRIDLP